MLSADNQVPLTIEKPAAGGRMIARHDGQVVLVSRAIPGERVLARVERAERSVAYAEAIEVLEPDPDRRPVSGDSACGGNVYRHIRYARQLSLKREILADACARIGRFTLPGPVPVLASREDGYRMRARLHVREGRVGFFREGTHDLCDAALTGQLLPETGRVLGLLAIRLKQAGAQHVTSVELAENMPGAQRALHLEVRPGAGVRTAAFTRVAGIDGVSGVTCQISSGAPVTRLGGTPWVTDDLGAILSAWREAAPAHESGAPEAPPESAGLREAAGLAARDVRRLLDAGYEVQHVEAFDLFPNTAHVESLVVLTRPS
ncbi:MAG: TRAM domain-containing protein [Acidobacteria bacterium]|nr:TRAM domain-containing protein [Acidobacteriota bacterium]